MDDMQQPSTTCLSPSRLVRSGEESDCDTLRVNTTGIQKVRVRAEGRGYADAAEWRSAHEDFFRSDGVSEFLGATPVIDDSTLVVTERFHLVKNGDGADH